MKVLMFGWEFPPFISGGLGTACYGLTKGLQELGVEVDFVLPTAPGATALGSPVRLIAADSLDVSFMETLSEDRQHAYKHLSTVTAVSSLLTPYQTERDYDLRAARSLQVFETAAAEKHSQKNIAHRRGKLFFQGGYGKNLTEEVMRLKAVGYYLGSVTDADIIHAHDWMTFPAAIEAQRASGLPLIVHVHATEYDRAGRIVHSAVYAIEQEGMRAADAVVAVSRRTKDLIVSQYHIPPEKISVVYNAVDKSDSEGAHEEDAPVVRRRNLKEPVVLFLGRVTAQKGPGYFLETARLVLQQRKDVRFVMAGSGDLLADMVYLCASMRLQDRFHFTGFLQGDELRRMFAASDVLVMTSVSEPFGIVPIEALKYGLSVIISKQSGVAEILPHAIMVDFWDTQLCAKSIVDLLDNPAKKRRHLEDNLETLKTIDWIHSSAELLKLYKTFAAQAA